MSEIAVAEAPKADVVTEQQSTQPSLDLAALEKLAFQEPPVSQPSFFPQPTKTEKAPEPTAVETKAEETLVVETPVQAEPAPVFDWKELGYQTPEELKADVELAKKAKTTPATSEGVYKDENAKRLAQAINDGKYEEVESYVRTQKLLSNVDSLSADQKLKLYIKLQNPRFDDDLVEDEFNDTYKVDEEKYEDDPIAFRKANIRLQQKIDNDLLAADEFFGKHKQKTELPAIQTPQTVVDQDYEDFKASTQEYLDVIEKVVKPSIQAVKESDVNFNFQLKDDNNQMDFSYGITVQKEDLDRAKNMALDWNSFVNKQTTDESGNFSAAKATRLILLAENFDKYVQSIARQAVNAERIRKVNEETPTSTQKDTNVVIDENPMKKLESMVFGV